MTVILFLKKRRTHRSRGEYKLLFERDDATVVASFDLQDKALTIGGDEPEATTGDWGGAAPQPSNDGGW